MTDTATRTGAAERPPLDVLWDATSEPSDDVRGLGMPAELGRRYGGALAIPLRAERPTIVANFVSTLDGIVAFGGDLTGGGLISGFHEPDRFVMALLRSLADVVVVGAGTLRGSSDHRWTAAHVHPATAQASAAWRRAMGLAAHPTTIVVSGSGNVPLEHPGLSDPRVPVVVTTTPDGARRLRGGRLGEHVTVEPVGGGGPLTGEDIAEVAARVGARLVVCEGGPHLLAGLVAADLLDELFLTLAPQLVGRGEPARIGLVEGIALSPNDARWHELVSVRRSTDHLFLRYRRPDDRRQIRES